MWGVWFLCSLVSGFGAVNALVYFIVCLIEVTGKNERLGSFSSKPVWIYRFLSQLPSSKIYSNPSRSSEPSELPKIETSSTKSTRQDHVWMPTSRRDAFSIVWNGRFHEPFCSVSNSFLNAEDALIEIRSYGTEFIHIFVGKDRAQFSIPKTLLCAKSEYFKMMFDGKFLEASVSEVTLDDIPVSVLCNFTEWIYQRRIAFLLQC